MKVHMFYYHARSITTTDPTTKHMTLSEYILEETNDGIDMARLLIDVMNGFIRGVTPVTTGSPPPGCSPSTASRMHETSSTTTPSHPLTKDDTGS